MRLEQYSPDLFAHANRFEPPSGVPADVALLFEELALYVASPEGGGHRHFSADAILHQIRWRYAVRSAPVGGFRINNNWSADLARWFLRKHPHMTGFFELRERRQETAE